MADLTNFPRPAARRLWTRVVALVTAASLAGPAHAERTDLCGALAREVERAEAIPPGLVQALALAESGRWLPTERRTVAWPWTVTSVRDTFYLPSKEAALAKVRELRAAGRTNIDVGCMQVNLGYHGHAFASLEQAIGPETNVAYGARFLKRLRAETRSWARATAYYHSRTPERGANYRSKVFRLWNEVRRSGARAGQGVRLAGIGRARAEGPVEADAPDVPRRLIVPGLSEPAPGAISILRGR